MTLPERVKERLVKRDGLDIAVKKSNEYRVREYVKDFFKDLEEIAWVLDMLPWKQQTKLFRDEDVYRLLELAERAMVALDFIPLRIEDNGKLVAEKRIDAFPENGSPRYFSTSGPATGQDIQRFGALKRHLARFVKFERIGPFAIVSNLDKIYYKDLIKEAKRTDYEPVELAETPEHLWLPRLTDGQKRFREVQQVLGGYQIGIDSQEELEELAEMWNRKIASQ
jgi:hypothetical protein